MRRLLAVTPLVGTLVIWAGSAQAISFGVPDGNAHPNVGALMIDFEGDAEGPVHICSGTLIDDEVFLTASHCTVFLTDQDEVFVTFAQDADPAPPPAQLHSGEAVTNPQFGGGFSDPHDVAVVLLDAPITTIVPAELPTLGLLDEMKSQGTLKGARFTPVGYGVQERQNGGGPPFFPYDGLRRRTTSGFNALNKAWLRLSQNPSTGNGGTCFGDSGGPNFLGAGAGETDIVASLTVTGDAVCRSTNTTYRLDTMSARGFLDDFVAVP
jgi:Trypsin